MNHRRAILATMIAAVVLGLAVAVPTMMASSAGLARSQISLGASYAPLPAAAHTDLGVSLDPLQNSQASAVQVTVPEAISAAEERAGLTSVPANDVTVLVGSFADDEYSTTNASGASSLVADDLPAYVVTFSGMSFANPSGGAGVHTQESVVINATTGDVVEVYSFQ